jgi:beta-carotene 3-hydroxylase
VTYLINGLIWLGTVAAMELVANLSHKYIMHGWGWDWHKSHHEPHDHMLEKNDLYALVFAIPSAGMMFLGAFYEHWILWVGAGMTTYGFLYFVVHDGLVHERWPFRIVPKSGYVKRLVQAHRLHHAVHGKDGCVSFGFLWAKSVADLKADLKRMHGDKGLSAEAQHGPKG